MVLLFCCAVVSVVSSFAIILLGKRELAGEERVGCFTFIAFLIACDC